MSVNKNIFFYRFIPDGTYLNARSLGTKKLAKIMNKTIHSKNGYYKYFKWHHYYTFHYPDESPDSDPICDMCSIFNIIKQMQATSSYMNISRFWKSDKKKSDAISASRYNLTYLEFIKNLNYDKNDTSDYDTSDFFY